MGSEEVETPRKMKMLYSIRSEPPSGAWFTLHHPKQQVRLLHISCPEMLVGENLPIATDFRK